MRPFNPYIVGNPIKDQSGFFGRQDIFREVMQVLRQRESNAIVLYGQRRIGKTSVLLQLEKRLAHEHEFSSVYFDLQDKAAKSLPEVLFELSQHISKTTGHAVPKQSDFDRMDDYFRSTFLPEIAEKVASGGLVLLFDEFDVLDSPMRTQASETFFPYLRQWMTDVQNVKFIFVIGRRPEDLSVRTMRAFKDIQSTRVSFLTKKDAEDVIRQSEKDGNLEWKKDAIQRVIELTHGHPYFTQLLCSVVWENAHEKESLAATAISESDVEKAVPQALKFGANAFNWLWDGLPPAERVVMAAMAEVKEEVITQDKLIEVLNQSGVRLVARELEFAPETLIDWELLIELEGGYRFAVPLLSRWVLVNRPLRRVKEELDRLNPLAENLFQAGQGYYESNNLDSAEQTLRQALNTNPNHLKARLLLGKILLEEGKLAESVDALDAAYQYDERSARADFIKSLLAFADTQEENLQLSTYERILRIQSDQPLANEKIRAIWVKRGEAAQAQENYEEALKAFEQIGDAERIEKIRSLLHENKLALDMHRAEIYEKSGQWKSALNVYVELASEYPESETLGARLEIARTNWRSESVKGLDEAEAEENWAKTLELCEALQKEFPDNAEINSRAGRARAQLGVTQKIHEALSILHNGQTDQARQMLSQVLAEDPKHLQAAHKLIEATYGKVKITRPVPLGAWILVMFTSLLWVLIVVSAFSGLLWTFLTPFLFPYYSSFPIELIITIALLLVVLIGMGVTIYAGRVLEAVFRVDVRGRLSYWRAIWTHFPFGMGLFYVDRSTRQKWIYPVVSTLLPIVLIFGPLFLGEIFRRLTPLHADLFNYYIYGIPSGKVVRMFEERDDLLESILRILLSVYLLSYLDVLVTCYLRRKNYYGAKREQWDKMPGQIKQVSQQHGTEQVSAMNVARKLTRRIKLSVQGLLRWVKSHPLIVLLGILTFLVLSVLILYDIVESGGWVYSWALAWVYLGLESAWWIVVLIIAIKAASGPAKKVKNWLTTKAHQAGSTSIQKESDPKINNPK